MGGWNCEGSGFYVKERTDNEAELILKTNSPRSKAVRFQDSLSRISLLAVSRPTRIASLLSIPAACPSLVYCRRLTHSSPVPPAPIRAWPEQPAGHSATQCLEDSIPLSCDQAFCSQAFRSLPGSRPFVFSGCPQKIPKARCLPKLWRPSFCPTLPGLLP